MKQYVSRNKMNECSPAVGVSLEVFRAGAGDSVVPDVADC